ncbi:junctional protein associated with coronary artery disease-like [Sinocyclocheilus rhinocerous]|uniref:junctional protein associated with coronary artery disease-like n=1 Tax=Sinocyclocheilus rhinocerous TaxID=307959 RepID=UPI0007B87603|nr:PREDICTED: junctional protein associated with coronary artery disease-like [Sinocyclocheilus rhinocerous]XP_016406404.1 PREDICTED: junctional protein associated with coronary artery disease-like [Sinocyclocheilus rhinocerous]XP_016406405.1 PREDICTED: junctional protein associated with coronary artery disease-like [Sinocyclocheilus rhinocerous]
MYSVEDLLISHGYKVPQRNSNNVPVSHSSSPHPATYEKCLPKRSDSRCEIAEKRKGHSGVNGYEGDHVYSSGGIRQAPARGFPSDAENRVRKQRTQNVDNGNLGDGRLPEDSLTMDSGFFETHRGIHSQPRSEQDVSYWRRRGQDFSVLMDYADFRDPCGSGGGVPNKPEGMQRRPESALSTEEHNRERQRRAESARAREREMALHQWRIAAERKYQSLGTEEWRPMTSMSRQPSENEVVQEQCRPRTAEGAVPPRTKNKSQSLPRMALQSESLQYFSILTAGQESYESYKLNGHHAQDPHGRHLNDGENRQRWTDRSGAQSAPLSKPRFSRPLRPPSYEVHQQMRGSAEILTGELAPRPRDRTPLPFSRQEYFVQELAGPGMEPPGYIPPPSYRRQPVVTRGHRTYPISMGNHQYRGDTYMQGSAMTEVQEWFIRQTGMAWPDYYRDGRRSMPCRTQAYPGYSEERMSNVQFIPFDDPRVRHILGAGIDGNSLTDADKIRNIRNEIPVNLLSEKSNDGAFPLTEKPFDRTEPSKSNISDSINEDSIHKEVLKETESSTTLPDQNCNRHPATQGNIVALQMTMQQNSNQSFIETVTQVKKFEAKAVSENKKNSKKKLKETMFCLVSVPISMQANKHVSDPNNNEKVTNSTENTVVQHDNQNLLKTSHKETQIQSSSSPSIKRSPLRKEIVDTRSLSTSQDNEFFYAGSWPGDHYRNQETQTGSPEVSRNTHPLANDHSSPHAITDNEGETNCSANYGYPMIGQKDLNPSRNSAFSRTRDGSSSSIRSPTVPQSASNPSSPDRQPLLRKTNETADGQEVFGQFLLKPVNRRKWDAIGELEYFNKEIQDHTGKYPNVDQNIEELDEALNSILELSDTNREVNNTRQETTPLHMKKETDQQSHIVQVTEMQMKSNNLNVMSDSGNRGHPEYKGIKSSLSKAKVNLDSQMQDIPVTKTDNYVNFEIMQRGDTDSAIHRQDIPVPKECLLKDVGLTVYTAIPDTVTSGSPTCLSPDSPMLTSPSDNSEICETLQITSSDSSGDLSRHSPEFAEGTQSLNNNNAFNSKALNKKEAGRGNTDVTRSGRYSRINVIKSLHCRFKGNYEDDDDSFYSDYLSWSNEKTLADEHLETLLSQEKANSMQTEDLSKLYQVQCAKGIPENESIEQRAARILGIAVPVETLVVDQVDDKPVERNLKTTDAAELAIQTKEISLNEEKQNVSRESEEVPDRSMESHGDMSEVGLGGDPESGEDLPRAEKHSQRVSSVLELPEFPPSNLCLSLPLTEDEELTLSVGGGDRKETANTEITEVPQNHLQAFCPPPLSPSSTNDQASMEYTIYAKEKSSQSLVRTITRITFAKETDLEEKGGKLKESVIEDETLVEENQYSENAVKENKSGKEDETLMEENQYSENAVRENKDMTSYMQEEDEQKAQEEVSAEEVILERSRQPPKSMARPIPQPRSGMVTKREITLPQGFNMDNTMPAIEDDDKLFISDAYDPSCVERV